MTTGSILLGIALLLLVGLFLVRPLLKAAHEEQGRLSRRQLLIADKEAILTRIRDLDFDYETGKMPDEIHQRQRSHLMNQAAEILQQLEQVDGKISANASEATDMDAAIEAAVRRMRQAKAVTGTQSARPTAANGGFCPNCGQPVDAGDKFCVSCGHKLRAKQPTTQ
jgi:hypothetical protein